MLWTKMHPKGVLALADEELMGREFEEGELVLAVNNFYKKRLAKKEEIIAIIRKAEIINAVGEESTRLLIDAGLAMETHVKRVQGIPHLQVFLI